MMLNKFMRTTCRLLPLLMVAVMLSACVNTLELVVPKSSERVGVTHEGAVANAREFFNTHFGSSTRSEEQQPTPEAPYVVGNLVPDWESGVTVANNEKVYSDFAMQKDFRYCLLLGEEGDERLQAVELYSRFVSVAETNSGTTSQYIVTFIPAEEYLGSYGAVAQDYGINCADNYEFSGVMLYTLPTGHHVAAYRYEGGELVAESFLYDIEQTEEENIADFVVVMEGLKVGIGEIQEVGTKAIITIPDIIWLDPETNKMYVYKYIGPPIHTPIVDLTTEYGFNITNPLIGDDHTAIGGGGGGTTTTEEEKLTSEKFADKILKNSLSPTDSVQLHTMLTEILSDCMGQTLLQEIYNNGVQISISFDSTASNSKYTFKNTTSDTGEIINTFDYSITINSVHGFALLHELFHFYQHHNLGTEEFKKAKSNYEVEAYIATYMYMDRIVGDTMDKLKQEFKEENDIGRQIITLYSKILNNASMIEYSYEGDEYFERLFIATTKHYSKTHDNAPYDNSQKLEQQIQNIESISFNCD